MYGYHLRREAWSRESAEGRARPGAERIQPSYRLTSLERVSLRIQRSDGAASIVDSEGLLTADAVVKVLLPPSICIVLDGPDCQIVAHLGSRRHYQPERPP